ncbi:MAG: alpha/beta hydrolase [Litorivicinus sp.]
MRFTYSLMALAVAATPALAQTEVTTAGLFADHYEGEGSTAVLVVHGTLAHKRMEIIETLATLLNDDYDLPVLAPNLSLSSPGRTGMVDCAQTHDHKDSDAATEIGMWVDWMGAQGYDNIIVAAHSRGGAQLSSYLASNPSDAISHAVLIAPATYNADYAAENYEKATGMPVADLLAKASALDSDTVMDVPRFVYCDNAKATAGAVLDYYTPRATRDTLTNLESVSVPTHIIMGSEDSVVEALPERLETANLGDTVTSETIDGADHFFRDLYADDIAIAIAERAGR